MKWELQDTKINQLQFTHSTFHTTQTIACILCKTDKRCQNQERWPNSFCHQQTEARGTNLTTEWDQSRCKRRGIELLSWREHQSATTQLPPPPPLAPCRFATAPLRHRLTELKGKVASAHKSKPSRRSQLNYSYTTPRVERMGCLYSHPNSWGAIHEQAALGRKADQPVCIVPCLKTTGL